MNKILPPDAFVQDAGTEKGRGVFANRNFAQGERIEAAPVLILLKPFKELPPRICEIVYNWQTLTQGDTPSSGLIYGCGSLYNHNNPANMRYEANADDNIMYYFAARDILKDEKLTVNHNAAHGDPVSEDDNWFKEHDIKPIINQ